MADTDEHEARFHRLYRANFRSIQAYAVNRVGSADDAADIVAEVFTAAWRRLDDIPPAADAAEVLGCSVNAIGIRLHRAKTRLRR